MLQSMGLQKVGHNLLTIELIDLLNDKMIIPWKLQEKHIKTRQSYGKATFKNEKTVFLIRIQIILDFFLTVFYMLKCLLRRPKDIQ